MFLIQEDNVSARYFLESGLIFLVSVSMLIFIFAPFFYQEAVVEAPARRKSQLLQTKLPSSVSRFKRAAGASPQSHQSQKKSAENDEGLSSSDDDEDGSPAPKPTYQVQVTRSSDDVEA